ncbi:MAG: SPFH domain-containing protein, partial [Candidatus Omnitrophota bacterium]
MTMREIILACRKHARETGKAVKTKTQEIILACRNCAREIMKKFSRKVEKNEATEKVVKKEVAEKKDKQEKNIGGSRDRILFAVSCWIIALFALVLTGSIILGEYGGAFIGVAAWLVLFAYTLRFFIVSVPEVTGLATINLLKGGELRPYGPGLHFKYPWEQVEEGNYINFRLVEKSLSETYPAKDGPVLKVKWFFQYRPQLDLLGRYIAVSEDVISTGLTDVGSKFLSQEIGSRWASAEECKTNQDKIADDLKKSFEQNLLAFKKEGANIGIPFAPSEGENLTLEWLYGIDLIQVGLADMDYEEKFQEVRSSKAVAKRLREIAEYLKRGDISEKDALNAAMIINKNITKNVQEVEGKG